MPATMASTSLAVYKTLDLTHLEEVVLEVIEGFGEDGCIYDQVQDALPHLPNSVSGRFLSLEKKGLIVRIEGDTRPGKTGNAQKVIRHVRFAKYAPPPPPPKSGPRNPFLKGLIHAAKVLMKSDPTFKGSPAAKALRAEIAKAAKVKLEE